MTMQFNSRDLYCKTARFDQGQHFLTEDEIRAVAPSVFAETAHSSRSDRFAPIPTIAVLRRLDKEGFGVVGAKQSLTRVEGKADFTKHMLRLRRKDTTALSSGDSVFEILLKNANDGTAAYDLLSGLFRILCANSLVAMSSQMETCRIRHSGSEENVAHKVIDATFRVLDDAERALTAPTAWGQINLNPDEAHIFAEQAHALRFPALTDGTKNTTLVTPEQLLQVRRDADSKSDLWTTFNRVQENAVRGGIHATGFDANNRPRRMTSREVKGIDQSTNLNRALWTLAEKMAELKKAA